MSEEIFGYVGLNQEPGFGVESGAAEVFGEVHEDTITMDNNLIAANTINSVRFDKYMMPGAVSASGGLEMDLGPEGITPWLMKGLFGNVASGEIDTGVYEHVFSVLHSSKLPSFNIRSGYGELAQNWRGSTVNQAAISFSRPDPLRLSTNILAQRPGESSDAASAVFSSVKPFNPVQTSFYFSGNDDIRFENFQVSFNNDVDVKHTMSGTRWCRDHVARRFSMRGSFTLEFSTEAERRQMWGSLTATGPQKVISPIHLSLIVSHPDEIAAGHKYYLKLDMPEVFIEAAPAGIHREQDRILQKVNFAPVYSQAHDKYADVVMRNGVPGYPDPA